MTKQQIRSKYAKENAMFPIVEPRREPQQTDLKWVIQSGTTLWSAMFLLLIISLLAK